jgi:hypothetical protein
MAAIDRYFLQLQFRDKVVQKTATEFQSAFADIMEKAFPDFKRTRAYGNIGDAGNDGCIPSKGIYYQVYAPLDPKEKESKAAQKLQKDFKKLNREWDRIFKIQKYYFVFNDRGMGTSLPIEQALAELRKEYPDVEFNLFNPNYLENIFLNLSSDDIIDLGFIEDNTRAIGIAYGYLNGLEDNLDRDNNNFVLRALNNFEDILRGLNNEDLQQYYEILEARVLIKLEREVEAREKLINLSMRYPNNPQPFLYLAELYLNIDDFEKNLEYLEKAENIDANFWLLIMDKLLRLYRLNENIDVSKVDENEFPDDPKIKSVYYRIYALFFELSGDQIKADSFIERAIQFNPNKIGNYDVKTVFIGSRIFALGQDSEQFHNSIDNLINHHELLEQKALELGEYSTRLRASIKVRNLSSYWAKGDFKKAEELAKDAFELLLQCYFDYQIDMLLLALLTHVGIPNEGLNRLHEYLRKAEKAISTELAETVIFQFAMRKALITEGKKFYDIISIKGFPEFIYSLENKEFDKAWLFVKDKINFAITMAYAAKEFPEFRKIIIDNLPDNEGAQKSILLIQLGYDENKISEAFDIIKGLDLSRLHYYECKPILNIAEQNRAWDYVLILSNKLLAHEADRRNIFELELQQFNANNHLGKYIEAINLGEKLLASPILNENLNDINKESLLAHTLQARLKRAQYAEAKMLLEKYKHLSITYDFKVYVEPAVYLKNNEPLNALNSFVEGLITLKYPTPEQYAFLYVTAIDISNNIPNVTQPLNNIRENCFVKLKNQERWLFIGQSNELNATPIDKTNIDYSKYIGKGIGEKILFKQKYHSQNDEVEIENILPIEKYILYQCNYHAHELTRQHRWNIMEEIEIPTTASGIDTKYLEARIGEIAKQGTEIFELYCKENLPFAFLAVNEGGLTNALSRINNENRGYINFSAGDEAEMNSQKEIANRIISGKPFYIDGTSALFLAESGILKEIVGVLPNAKVPQSVITYLFTLREKLFRSANHMGYMAFVQGKLRISQVDETTTSIIRDRISTAIELLESNPTNIIAISQAAKSPVFSEQKVPPELCDACILAQREDIPILTEDILFLLADELETGKKRPDYCSSYALIRMLYELKGITFEQYLDYFSYLSSYRLKFLPISTADIEKTIFGDGRITILRPDRIRQLRFALTLSPNYGVPFDRAFQVVKQFIVKLLLDNSILPDLAINIFSEILSSFPTNINKGLVGKMLLKVSEQTIKNTYQNIIIGPKMQEKLDSLLRFVLVYTGEEILLS